MTMSDTVDFGYAKQMQYATGGRRRHAVVKDDKDRWVTSCKEKPATREYKGWPATVNCQGCRDKIGLEKEKQ
jgi:hypothetical protein